MKRTATNILNRPNYKSKLDYDIASIIFVVVFIVLWWPNKIEIFNYIDEFIALICLCLFAINYKLIRNKECVVILFSLFILLFFGLFASLISGINQNTFAIFVDAFSLIKFPITYLGFKYCISIKIKRQILKLLLIFAKIYIIFSFIFGIINLIYDIGMSYDIRYGIRSFAFIHSNPAKVGALIFICLLLLSVDSKKQHTVLNICSYLVVIFTLRAVCIATLGVYLLCKFILKFKPKIKFLDIVIFAIVATILAWPQIKEYFLSESLRSILLRGGLDVFKMYAPFGSGFASYGSDMAYKFYSPLYFILGFDKIWGLNLEYGGIINDNFWPMLIGQFGLYGVPVYLVILFVQLNYILKANIGNKVRCAALASYVFLFASSIGAAIYTHEISVAMVMIFSIVMTIAEEQKIRKATLRGN